MLFSSLIKSVVVATSLVSSAVAHPAHVHNQHKRGVVVVTQTQTVVVTAGAPQVVGGQSTTITFSTVNTDLGEPTSLSTTISREAQYAGSSAPVASASSETTTLSSTTGDVTSTKVEQTSSTAVPSSASTSTSSTSSSSAVSTPSSSSSGSFSGKGVTYSPYTASGNCKSLSEVQSDLAQLTDFEIIRLYGVDCTQVENVLQSKADGQKLFLGIYFVSAIEDGVSQIASAIEKYGSWDDVYTVSIGNELVNGGQATVSQVSEYVSTGRSALTAAGYSGPVVSVDTHIATINNPGLCSISDYIAINAHAYFDYNTEAADAGDWLLLQIQRVWSACGGDKTVFVTESGWPSQGDTYGKAIASEEAQSAAISSLKKVVGDSVILFNAFNDLWKADGFLSCEKYWGILN